MKNTESINMQTDEKQPNPNDSKTIKYGCIIFLFIVSIHDWSNHQYRCHWSENR